MRGRTLVVLSIILAVLGAGSSLLAQQPGPEKAEEARAQAVLGTGFTYQGQLTDGDSPADGEYDFEFKLCDDADAGVQVGDTVTVEDRIVADGLFTVELDFGSGAFNGEPRYLEIGVRLGNSSGAYTTLSPRQALTPAPYALLVITHKSQVSRVALGSGCCEAKVSVAAVTKTARMPAKRT